MARSTVDIFKQGFIEQQIELTDAMQEQITKPMREYPNTTIRKEGVGVTGKIAGSPRDVVDTGELRDSYKRTIEETKDSVTVIAKWSAEHGKYIYYGTDKQPPYRWIKRAIRRMR